MVSLSDGGTLARLFADLTSGAASTAFPKFIAAIKALPGGVTSDDPFGGAPQPALIKSHRLRQLRASGGLIHSESESWITGSPDTFSDSGDTS
jgi:hypothetical protein